MPYAMCVCALAVMDNPTHGVMTIMRRRTMVSAAVAMTADADANPADVDTDNRGICRAGAQQGYGEYGGDQSFHRPVFRGLRPRHAATRLESRPRWFGNS